MSDDILREAEADDLSEALRRAGWAPHTSVVRELACWERLGREVNLYKATIDDYTNDLCSRDYLADALAKASGQLHTALAERVNAADATFRKATIDDTDGLVGRYYRVDAEDGWWWRARPASGPLADYLETSE